MPFEHENVTKKVRVSGQENRACLLTENVTKKYTFSGFGFQLPEKNAESILDLPICQGLGQEAAT